MKVNKFTKVEFIKAKKMGAKCPLFYPCILLYGQEFYLNKNNKITIKKPPHGTN